MPHVEEPKLTAKIWEAMATQMASGLQIAAGNTDLDYSHLSSMVLLDAVKFLDSACEMNSAELFGYRADSPRIARANYGLAYQAFENRTRERGAELRTLQSNLEPNAELLALADFIRRLSSKRSAFFQGQDFRSSLIWAAAFFRALAALTASE